MSGCFCLEKDKKIFFTEKVEKFTFAHGSSPYIRHSDYGALNAGFGFKIRTGLLYVWRLLALFRSPGRLDTRGRYGVAG